MKISESFLKDQIHSEAYDRVSGTTTTICRLHLKNGFIVIGQSACLNPSDFSKECGERISFENAFSKLWELYGFAALQKKHEAQVSSAA